MSWLDAPVAAGTSQSNAEHLPWQDRAEAARLRTEAEGFLGGKMP